MSLRTRALPTYEQVARIPAEPSVPFPPHPPLSGVRDVTSIRALGSTAGRYLMVDLLQVHDEYRAERGLSMFTAEHHHRYFCGVPEGHLVSSHGLIVDRSDRAIQVLALMLDDTARTLPFAYEAVYVHVDLSTRRVHPMPDDLAARVEELHRAALALDWPVPLSGAVGIRH
ncbi:MAG: thioesterase family protein [Aeromicrobium sp.]